MLEMGQKSEIQCGKGHFNLLTGSFLPSRHLAASRSCSAVKHQIIEPLVVSTVSPDPAQ